MPERCDQTNVVYQADVHAENKVMSYYGSTENEFKKRCSTHKSSFRKIPKFHTTLSLYIWKGPFKDYVIKEVGGWFGNGQKHPYVI